MLLANLMLQKPVLDISGRSGRKETEVVAISLTVKMFRNWFLKCFPFYGPCSMCNEKEEFRKGGKKHRLPAVVIGS